MLPNLKDIYIGRQLAYGLVVGTGHVNDYRAYQFSFPSGKVKFHVSCDVMFALQYLQNDLETKYWNDDIVDYYNEFPDKVVSDGRVTTGTRFRVTTPITGEGGKLTIGGYDYAYTGDDYLPCNLSINGGGEAAISGFDDVELTDGYVCTNPSFTEPDGATYANRQLSLSNTTIGIPTSTGLTISDVEVFKSNAADILGDGTASLDLSTWTLTLNGLHQSDNGVIMHFGMTVATPHALTINLVGENDLFGPTTAMGINGTDVTITSADGSGVLNATAYEQGIVSYETNLVIDNCQVNARAGTQVLVNNSYNPGTYQSVGPSTLTVTDATLILGPNPSQREGEGIEVGMIIDHGGMTGGPAMYGFEELILNRTKIKTPNGGFFVPNSQDREQYDWCWANVLCQTTNDEGETVYVEAPQVVIAPHQPSSLLAIRIGDDEPILKQQSERGDVTVEYSVNEDTYLYIYAAESSSQSTRRRMLTTAAKCVKIYSISFLTDDSSEAPTDNMLLGSDMDEWTWGGDIYYKLTYSAEFSSFGFFRDTQDGEYFLNPAHTAYLALSSSLGEGCQGFPLKEIPTGIEPIQNPQSKVQDDSLFTRTSKVVSDGQIYIIKGDKVYNIFGQQMK